MINKAHASHPSSSPIRSGFTIVELLIVIVVIAILAAISIVAYRGIQDRARDAAIASKESQVRKKLAVYKVENETYPVSQSAFDTLIGQTPSDQYYTTYSSASPYDTYTISTNGTGSIAITCPTGFIVVPGNPHYGTSDFCVMKYEAKNIGSTPTSQASSSPWVSISQTSAITTAQSACSGCHLITEAEWMTIAMNVISVPSNWVSGTVGSGAMYRGHSDSSPNNALVASSNDSDGWSNTGDTTPSVQRRTLTLTNGEVIWDFAGNVGEWTNATITGGQPGFTGEASYVWKDYSNGVLQWNGLPVASQPTGTLYPRSQGAGGLYSNAGESASRAFIRGGDWNGGDGAGAVSLNLANSPTGSHVRIGFRAAK